MVIEIKIYTLSMSFDPIRWQEEFDTVNQRVSDFIKDAVMDRTAGTITDQTFLDEETGYVVATVNIRPSHGGN